MKLLGPDMLNVLFTQRHESLKKKLYYSSYRNIFGLTSFNYKNLGKYDIIVYTDNIKMLNMSGYCFYSKTMDQTVYGPNSVWRGRCIA